LFEGLKLRALAATAATILIAIFMTGTAFAAEGSVRMVKRHGSEFDRYTTSATSATRDWINAKMTRMLVFTPYFDNKTAWFKGGWLYQDVYAIYTEGDVATQHPDWILRDGAGRKLYIPWGCSGGTCPQYAGDITNAAFRRSQIDRAKAAVARGYRGLWLDDVNLEFRVGDGTGRQVAPIDSRTGKPMTWTAWRDAMATFVEEFRAAVPASVEIVHNSIWFAAPGRDADPYVRRQIAAADVINLERGVNDDGLTGGAGEWSLNAFLAFVDRVHAMGKAVVFDAYDDTAAGREYSLASYLLISNGRDGLGESHAGPDNWWAGWDVDLGPAAGARTTWNGLMRRDFAGGTVLVNEPGAPARTVQLPRPMRTVGGATVTSVTLSGSRGAVLLGPPTEAGPGDPPAPGTVTGPPPASEPTEPPSASEPAGPSSSGEPMTPATEAAPSSSAPRSPATVGSQPRSEPLLVHVTRRGRVVRVRGRAPAATGGRAELALQRRRHGRWTVVRRRTVRVDAAGRFAARFGPLRPARYRAFASAGVG
jgi:hypothetical protein